MDLLNYGMENKDSRQPVKRAAAKAALRIVKLQADLYDWYLSKRWSRIPNEEEMTEELLEKLRQNIERQSAGQMK